MNQKIKEKVAKAVNGTETRKDEPFQQVRCPLKCWDIFVMLKEDYKSKKSHRKKS